MITLHSRIGRRPLLAGLTALAGSALAPAAIGAQVTSPRGHAPSTPEASPVANPGATTTQLATLLGKVSAEIAAPGRPGTVIWTYFDLDQQFSTLNVARGKTVREISAGPIVGASQGLVLSSPLIAYAMDEELEKALGFTILGMDQALVAGVPPDLVTVLRGPYEPDALTAAWEAAGYTQGTSASGVETWTIGPDGDISFESVIKSKVLASCDNLAIVDGLVIATSLMSTLENILTIATSGSGSMADDPVYGAPIAAMPATIVSALGFVWADSGSAERASNSEDMPPYSGLLAGVHAGVGASLMSATPVPNPQGETSHGSATYRLVMQSADDAEIAAQVFASKWEAGTSAVTGEPLTEIMTVADTHIEKNVAVLDMNLVAGPGVWSKIFQVADLEPFAPSSAG